MSQVNHSKIDFEGRLRDIEGLFESGRYTSAGVLSVYLIEQALREVYRISESIFPHDDKVKLRRAEKTKAEKAKGNKVCFDEMTLGEIVGFLKTSDFFELWEVNTGKKINFIRFYDLNHINKIRNALAHSGEELDQTGAKLLAGFLKDILTNFEIVTGADMPLEPKAEEPPRENFPDISLNTVKSRKLHYFMPIAFIVVAAVATVFFLNIGKSTHLAPSSTSMPYKPVQASQPVNEVLRLAYTERMSATAPAAAVDIVAKDSVRDSSPWRRVKNGDSLSSNNPYRIQFYSEEGAYFYIIQIDSRGNIEWLFPENDTSSVSTGKNPVPGGKWVSVPGENSALYLDENLGIEHLYIIGTTSPWEKLKGKLNHRSPVNNGSETIQATFALKTRGVGGKMPATSYNAHSTDGKAAGDVRELIQGTSGVLVVERWFRHVKAQEDEPSAFLSTPEHKSE